MTESISNEGAFFAQMLAEHGITAKENNVYHVEINGKEYSGSLSDIFAIINGGASWPAEPLGVPDNQTFQQ